eukprot:CAMPEP_0183425938 /NCGR_PEP_ID=MMETSP0370-20130417/37213_1 /TAXON_ID=268820 /ORGANISM="Peridinium aciculiferum, Strain PAER-2" /LENGTH=78 /DNA_ID=CAMNT_0025610271 /DNA_START=21 /DNA_END=255 /DNA_ORIENTATION=+
MVDGERIAPDDTAEKLGLEDEDLIDVAMEQTVAPENLASRARILGSGHMAHRRAPVHGCRGHGGAGPVRSRPRETTDA